jgi:hypothetical protein
MPIPFRFRLTKPDSTAEEICEGAIPDEDWAIAVEFREYALELESAEWVKSGLDAGYDVKFSADSGTVVEVPKPPTDTAVREVLLLLRPFILDDEPTSFLRVLGILRRYMSHPALKQLFEQRRRIFLKGQLGLYGEISISGPGADPLGDGALVLNDTKTLNLWLNAFVYHRDADKREALLSHFGSKDDELVHATLRALIADKTQAVIWLATFIDQLANSATVRRAPSQRADANGQQLPP